MNQLFKRLGNLLRKKKKWLMLFFFLYLLAGPGGCARLEREYDMNTQLIVIDAAATRHWSPQPIPERFFGGTKENISRICNEKITLKTPFYLLDVPFELIADSLFLPKDVFLYADYLIDPPLSLLVQQNKYDKLKKRLANGDNPNATDQRRRGVTPVGQALSDHNAAIYALLLEYGAASGRPYEHYHYIPNAKEIIQLALKHDGSLALINNDGLPVFEWCRLLKDGKNMTPEAQENCIFIIEMLLEHGFSAQIPHEYWEQNKRMTMTPLDLIMACEGLSPERTERLVSSLKAHGALTLEEVTSKNNNGPSTPSFTVNYPAPCDFSSQLKKDGIEIDPVFKQAVSILMADSTTRYYRISTTFPGLEHPVLVIDFGGPNKKGELIYRQRIKIHRRLSKTEWNQQTEEFESPVYGRLIFTPKGIRIPSRLSEEIPQCLLREAWLSFSDCECYCESLGAKWSSFPEENTSAFIRKADGNAVTIEKKGYWNHLWSNDRPIYTDFSVYRDTITQADKRCLEKASQATAEAGIAGDWARINYTADSFYCFTNHDRFKETLSEEIVPYPDEIFCSLHIYKPTKQNQGKGTPVIRLNGLEGKSYWNCRSAAYKGMQLQIFFGDEVPLETVERLHQTLAKALQ